jgi:hypothetical protein
MFAVLTAQGDGERDERGEMRAAGGDRHTREMLSEPRHRNLIF